MQRNGAAQICFCLLFLINLISGGVFVYDLPQTNLCRMYPKFLTTTFTVSMPRIPSMATLALNLPLKALRFDSLTTRSFYSGLPS